MKTRRKPRGILMVDLLVATAMAIALLMAMTASVSLLQRGERRMAETRAGVRQLELALWNLQAGAPVDQGVTIERLPAPAVAGQVWVRVALPARGAGAPQTLVGMVPAASVPEGVAP